MTLALAVLYEWSIVGGPSWHPNPSVCSLMIVSSTEVLAEQRASRSSKRTSTARQHGDCSGECASTQTSATSWTQKTAFIGLFRSGLKNGATIWDHHLETQKKTIKQVQNRAIGWCQGLSPRHQCSITQLRKELQLRTLGAVSIRKTVLPGMAIPMLKIRRPNGRLIFNMEIAIRR